MTSNLARALAKLSPERRRLLEQQLRAQGLDLGPALLLPQPRDGADFPASYAQQRLWFLQQLEPASGAYNVPSALRLAGPLDLGLLERALAAVVERHEVLRTALRTVDGQPRQVIVADARAPLHVVDLRPLAGEARADEARRLLGAEAGRPFDLASAPLLRALALRLADDETVVALTMHHAIADGWSSAVLLDELIERYGAFARGEAAPLPPLPLQYADYAVWQRRWLEGPVREQQLAYWRRQLAGCPGVLELPTDRPRPPVRRDAGAQHSFALPDPLAEGLRALSLAEGATLFMTMLAAFQVLLMRHSGQEEFCVGTPVAGRAHPELEGLIGFFVNTLALRADLTGEPTFRALLARVREAALGAFANQDLPFELLVEALQPERDPSRTPLFQTMFALQHAPARARQLDGLAASAVEAPMATAMFDLTLTIFEADGGGLSGELEYSTDLFDAVTVALLAERYCALLAAILAAPDQPVSALPLHAPGERQRVLEDWNATAVAFADGCVHQLIEIQVARAPAAPALIAPGGASASLTYGQLNARANQLAHHLRACGVGPDQPVGLCCERSPEQLVSVLAVLKAGGALLPLDPSGPAARLKLVLEDARPAVLLADDPLPPALAEALGAIAGYRPIVAGPAAGAGYPTTNPRSGVRPEHLAYVIYTSGSTGAPKGVMVEHRSVLNHNQAVAELFGLGPSDRVLQFSTLTFDAAIEEIFPAWQRGAALVLRPAGPPPGTAELVDLVARHGVTVLDLPTAYWHGLAADLAAGAGPLPPHLRLVAVGGEAASAASLAAWQAAGGPRWLNTYGPTEATVIATAFEPLAEPWPGGAIPIGRPLPNVRAYVLDGRSEPAPVGVAGELFIGGAAVARGYLNRPALTAERFVADPFSGLAEARMYRTGDRARWRHDGALEYLGRADDQVKIRGFRVEPGEVEAALAEHPGVGAAAVVAREDRPGERRLVAYLVRSAPADAPAPGGAADELRRFLRTRLPEYMLPAAFVTLAALPMTASGKVDRKALPAPAGPDHGAAGALRTPTEELLAALWADLLGGARAGAEANFFELGGHSLLATQLVSRVRDLLGVELPVRAVFEAPTLAAFAAEIDRARSGGAPQAPPIGPAPRHGPLPLSFAQQRLWFLDQLEPGSPQYNLADAARLGGRLEPALLERALNALARRHEALRTSFTSSEGRAAQLIADELALELPLVDLAGLPEAAREPEALRLAAEEARRPFDLGRAPLLRARLLRLGPDDHLLLLVMHHIVADGWSLGVLTRELATLYGALARGEPAPLPELPVQYADFAVWQRGWLQGEALEAQLSYWRRRLAGCPPLLALPTDRPRPRLQSFRGAYRAFSLDAALAGELRALSRREGATLFMTLMAVFQALLGRYSGQDDLCVGTPVAGRNRAAIEGLIGFFVNTLVIRADLSGDPSLRTLLRQVRETTLDAYAHQDVPFEMVVDALQPERDLSHTPLFQVVFALQHAPRGSGEGELTLRPVEVHSGTAKYDLALFMHEDGEQLGGALEYNCDLFDEATIDRLLGHFQRLLAGAAADPDLPLALQPLLSAAERAQLTAGWNATARPYPADQTVQQLIAAQAARRPDAPAVRLGDTALSYAELERRANRLARYLQGQGVGPETLVGICLERSPELIVAMLAVLKAGGAYLPLDPSYPAERLAFMLDDARPLLLLATGAVAARAGLAGRAALALLDDFDGLCGDQPATAPPCASGPDSLAYVIYTSGSTGRPKGTLLQHGGLVNLCLAWVADLGLGPGERVLQFFAFGFDGSVLDIFPTLVAGATLCLIPPELALPGPELAAYIGAVGATQALLPPAALAALPAEALPALRTVISGGEACTAELAARWLPGRRFFNAYGPTETTVAATWHAVSDPAGGPVPIGRPIANTQAYLLDRRGQLVPAGVPGELYIGGAGVARGYLNRPELTAERFVPDPFSGRPGARLYRTGDLARHRPDGALEFLGRTDHQVKIRGFRIELGEIEALLRREATVREAAVLAREDAPGRRRLVAYVVPAQPDAARDALVAALRAALQASLPAYMLPSAFVLLGALPLTPSGKLDRGALPAPEPAGAGPAAQAPRTPAEATLARIWAQLLGLERVGLDDNFFELGGDSILSIQVVARAGQEGLRVTARQLFEHPTVAGLAAVADTAPLAQAEQGALGGPAPLTPIQRWFFAQGLPRPHHFNQSLLLELRRPLEPELLERALGLLVAHHDALRARFRRAEAGWEQWLAEREEQVRLARVDLAGLAGAEQRAALEAAADELQASLDLGAGPLLRAAHFAMGAAQPARLLLVVHHLVVDGVSWPILLEDLHSLYEQLAAGVEPQLPPKTSSFRQWGRRLEEHAQAPATLAELDDWLALGRGQAGRLPRDGAADAAEGQVVVALDPDETARLLQPAPRALGVGVDALLLAALARALCRWSGAPAALVDLESHGRAALFDDLDLSRTVGWFTSVYPVLLPAGGEAPLATLRAVKERLGQVPQGGLGYGLLRYLAPDPQVAAALTALPQAEVAFNYLGQVDRALAPDAPFALAAETGGRPSAPGAEGPYALTVTGSVVGGQLHIIWSYGAGCFRPATIERVAQAFLAELRGLLAAGDSADGAVYTPSDFKLAKLDQRKLDKVLARLGTKKEHSTP